MWVPSILEMADPAVTIDVITNPQVRHVFLSSECLNHGQIIEALEDFDHELLIDVRKELFTHSLKRFESQLDELGILDSAETDISLSLKNRQPSRSVKGGSTNLVGKDIICLYEYAAQLVDIFPKDVLTAN